MKVHPNMPDYEGLNFAIACDIHHLHYCELYQNDYYQWAPAIELCFEDLDGRLFVENGEYGSQVNYCPQCGYKARVGVNSSDNV